MDESNPNVDTRLSRLERRVLRVEAHLNLDPGEAQDGEPSGSPADAKAAAQPEVTVAPMPPIDEAVQEPTAVASEIPVSIESPVVPAIETPPAAEESIVKPAPAPTRAAATPPPLPREQPDTSFETLEPLSSVPVPPAAVERPPQPESAEELLDRLRDRKRHARSAQAAQEPSARTSGSRVEHSDQTPPPVAPSRTRAPKGLSSWDIESLIGGRWYAIGGALAVVTGMILFLKLGIDRGWFAMSPAVKCSVAAAFGFALIAVGEMLRRRVSAFAAAGAFAAGLGVVYSSVYAAFRLYGLLPDSVAFGLLGATALMGIFISVAARLPVISVVSITGGYLAPFLFSDTPSRPIVLPAYLMTLLVIGLGVAAVRGREFIHLRSLVRIATLVLGGLWFFNTGHGHPQLTGVFSVAVWIAYHLELLWSTFKHQLPDARERTAAGTLTVSDWQRWAPIASTFSVTAWSSILGVLALREAQLPDWYAPAAYFASTGFLGILLAGHLDGLRRQPSNDRERLGAVLLMQSAALFVITVALLLGGWAQVTAWLIMSVVAMLTGNLLRSRVFHVYALCVLVICTGRLLVYDMAIGTLNQPVAEWMGINLSVWTLLMALTGLTWCINAICSLRMSARPISAAKDDWAAFADTCTFIGLGLPAVALCVGTPDFFTRGWIILACAVSAWIWAAFTGRSRVGQSSEMVAGVAFMCALASQWWSHESGGIDLAGLFLTPRASLPAAVAVFILARAFVRARDPELGWAANVLFIFAIVVLGAVPMHEQTTWPAVITVWCLLAIVVCAMSALRSQIRVVYGAAPLLLVSGLVWVFQLAERPWSDQMFVSGMTIFVALLACPKLLGLGGDLPYLAPVRKCFAVVGALLLLVNTSMEVAHIAARIAEDSTVRSAAVSIWWGVFALALIIVGFWRSLPIFRHAGLLLLAAAAAKGLILDLWLAPAIWRIASLVLLGLMMMAVAAGYQKVIRVFEERKGVQ